MKGIGISRRVHRHVHDRAHGRTAADRHLTDADDLRGDIADAMDAEQLAVGFAEDQLEKSAATRDRAAWRAREIGMTGAVVQILLAALLFSEPAPDASGIP